MLCTSGWAEKRPPSVVSFATDFSQATLHVVSCSGPIPMSTMSRTRSIWTSVLVIYWMLLLVATHIPQVPLPDDVVPPDYLLHFVAYAVLALLCAVAWSMRRALGLRELTVLVVLLATYGAADEWTQTPVGRDASVGDWIANLIGIVAGLLLYRVAASRIGRRVSVAADSP